MNASAFNRLGSWMKRKGEKEGKKKKPGKKFLEKIRSRRKRPVIKSYSDVFTADAITLEEKKIFPGGGKGGGKFTGQLWFEKFSLNKHIINNSFVFR